MNFIIILIGFDIDIDIFTQLNTTVSRQSLLLVLLFSNTISAIRPEDPPRKEKWILGTARRQRQPKDSSCWIEGSSRGKRWHNDHPHWHWTHCVCCRLVHILNWLTIYHEYLLCSCCCCCCCLKSESHLIVVVVDVVVVVIVVVVLIAIVWNEADQVVASDHHWEEAKSIESTSCMVQWLLIKISSTNDFSGLQPGGWAFDFWHQFRFSMRYPKGPICWSTIGGNSPLEGLNSMFCGNWCRHYSKDC